MAAFDLPPFAAPLTAPSDAVRRAEDYAPFLRHLIERHPDLAEPFRAGDLATARAALTDSFGARDGIPEESKLRIDRARLALTAALMDLSGAWGLGQVTAALSDFADHATDRAIAAAFAERYDAPPAGFTVIGLGKHGGRELNYSSDIDPIFLFDPNTHPTKGRDDGQEAAIRTGRRVIELLSARTIDGYVFRVDMRLRPSPEVTPIVLPVEGAISYYESSALAWEQAAFIRARVAAGDRALGDYFMAALRPFVWRKSLDFGQIENIAAMSRAIRDHYHKGQVFGGGFDIKRGRGGIRECEFFAQVHQLIHGGRDPALRVPDTRAALTALSSAGKIEAADAAELASAYTLLRTIEHRLQMVDDRQTHELPKDAAALDNVARLHGLPDGGALVAMLEPVCAGVGTIYDALTHEDTPPRERLAEAGAPLDEQIGRMGFADIPDVLGRVTRLVTHWRSGQLRAIRSAPARAAFENILPEILRAIAASPDPERALIRFDALIERLPTAINFFHLLDARPALLALVGRVLAHAPVLADALAGRAELMDGLIDARALDLPGGVSEIARELGGDATDYATDYERLLDRVRERVGEHRFALGVQLIEGAHDPLDIAEGYARVAEAAIAVLVPAAMTEFEAQHGRVPDSDLVILALGRLGGGALTYASDLDLVFLFSGSHEGQSDGRRPLGATQYYNKLSQRIVAALSVATAAGPLYEVDTRLRPNGTQGLLAVSIDSFARYQAESAWSWEHMALCRARPVFGPKAARAELAGVIADTLARPRDAAALAQEVAQMRRDIQTHKPPKGALDAKLLPGGLVDVEFLTHYLQLSTGEGLFPGVERAIAAHVAAGRLDAGFAAAHAFMTRMLVVVRLVSPTCDEPPLATQGLVAARMDCDDWNAMLAQFNAHRALVIEQWQRHLGSRDFANLPQKDMP